jgi:hypothetical protein
MRRWRCATILSTAYVLPVLGAMACSAQEAPYPPSACLGGVTWHWETLLQAAPGSDLWPVTWASDGQLYAAWGDGGGFGGTNSEGRVATGFARIEGSPEGLVATNVNGGVSPEHAASFPARGKADGIVCVDGTLYGWLNAQDGRWPDVDYLLISSRDLGATWETAPWTFPKGEGRLKPAAFVQFGQDYGGVPASLEGFVYFVCHRQALAGASYMGRAPRHRLTDRGAYEFIIGWSADGSPEWGAAARDACPIFSSPADDVASVTYVAGQRRYLAAAFHGGPSGLALFDAPAPWGPWTTVAYYDDWGGMGPEGEGLCCSFPAKWASADGLDLWCVFSVYGEGAERGIRAHDCFNVARLTLSPAP